MGLFITSTVIAFSSYLIATSIVLSCLFSPKKIKLGKILPFAVIAILAHAYGLSQQFLSFHAVNFSLPNVISLVSLVITASVTLVSLRYKVNLLLPVTYGFAALWQIIFLFLPSSAAIKLDASSVVLVVHISIALIAYSILVIANLFAFQVSFINNKLKNKNMNAVNQLPPLMQVEKQFFLILAIGTLSLLASEMVGFVFLENFFAKEQLHKTILSLAALLLYALTIWGHYQKGWRGHKVLTLTTTATMLLTLSYFGSRFVKEFLLS